MPGRQAKTLSSADVNDLLVFASCTRNPLRNRMIVLLSAKAGLRAREIANLTWDMVLGPTGQISGIIELRDHATVHAATAKPRTPRSSGPNGTAPALRDFDLGGAKLILPGWRSPSSTLFH